jgi:large subunit ribosomal protein L17
MRHRKKTVKLGRTAEHRNALLANQTCSLIEHGRIKTTLAKAKAVKPLADKMITLAKRDTLHARRRALALLHNNSQRTAMAVQKLFAEIGPRSATRNGGYTRIVKLGPRTSDSAQMAFIEWVDLVVTEEAAEAPAAKTDKKTAPKKPAKSPAPVEEAKASQK